MELLETYLTIVNRTLNEYVKYIGNIDNKREYFASEIPLG